ncbi:PEGA domain protein [Posidoniimonas polymericola]|uniref:PEGA domain protein n=1 Tax=Posidoniimonas polymericola TaxID=2528002 RepID=A0A5C5YSN3_9BACT|nr:PEGA domain-containing protein [Posidoniimonas polymericola]TWT77770.1 PEGA domain protein [Posidoniimonas polymericola]
MPLLSHRHALGQRTTLVLLVAAALLSSGCVRRRLMVRTNPPGALLYVDNQQIGTTPCGVDFTYYGTRELRVVKAGYETLTVNQPIPTPWYETPGVDFVSENLVPWRIRDDRVVSLTMSPQRMIPSEELKARGQQLRAQANQPIVPTGAILGAPVDPFAGSTSYPSAGPSTVIGPPAGAPGSVYPGTVPPANVPQPGFVQPGPAPPASTTPAFPPPAF